MSGPYRHSRGESIRLRGDDSPDRSAGAGELARDRRAGRHRRGRGRSAVYPRAARRTFRASDDRVLRRGACGRRRVGHGCAPARARGARRRAGDVRRHHGVHVLRAGSTIARLGARPGSRHDRRLQPPPRSHARSRGRPGPVAGIVRCISTGASPNGARQAPRGTVLAHRRRGEGHRCTTRAGRRTLVARVFSFYPTKNWRAR